MRRKWLIAVLGGAVVACLSSALVGCDLFGSSDNNNNGGGNTWNGGSGGDEWNGKDPWLEHEHHMTEHLEYEPATCTEDGHYEYYYCSECGRYFADAAGKEVCVEFIEFSLGHIMQWVPLEGAAPTCTEEGIYSSYYTCMRCGKNFEDEAGRKEIESLTLSPLGHNFREHAALEATCTSAGNILYYACSRCGDYYSDKDGTQKIADKSSVTLPKEEHDMTEHIGTPATCLEDGEATYYACSKCHKNYTDEAGTKEIEDLVLPATGHLYSEEWIYDEARHWREPVCEHKDELENIEEAAHTMDGYECTECEYDTYTKGLSFEKLSGSPSRYALSGLGEATDTEIVVQPTYMGYPVVSVSSGAFKNNTTIESILFLDGLESIGSSAFAGCTALTSVTLPESVNSLGGSVFAGCTALNELIIPAAVKSVSFGMFEGCDALIEYEGGISYVGKWAVFYDESEKNVVFRADTEHMATGLFKNCKSLESVELFEGLTKIEQDMFYMCTSLKNVVIPSSVKTIDYDAFYGCSSLERLRIPKGLTEIKGTFRDCGNLIEITVEAGNPRYKSAGNCLIDIEGKSILRGCNDSVIPDDGSVTYIGQYAFNGCNRLTDITIPESIKLISFGAFGSCTSLTEIVLPRSITEMGDAFYGCRALTIYCEAEEKPELWDDTWTGCPVVWDYRNNSVADDGAIYAIIGGVRYALKDGEATVVTQSRAISGNAEIPDALAYDGEEYTVTSIVEYAFDECRELGGVSIGDNVTSIGHLAFYKCSSLESVSIGKGVKELGQDAFAYCGKLSSVYYNCVNCDDLANWGSDVWQGAGVNGNGIVATIGKDVVKLPNNLFNWRSSSASAKHNLTEVIFEENSVCETIGASTFYSCTELTSIELPQSVKTIQNSAFNGCSSLMSIYLGLQIETVEESAFYDSPCVVYCEAEEKPKAWSEYWCSGATAVWNCKNNVLDEEGYEHILVGGFAYALKDGAAVFARQATNLKGEVTVPASVTYKGVQYPVTAIGNYAFYYCSSITSVVISEGITSIGSVVFWGCSGLTNVVIPDGVTSIGDSIFYNCRSLTSIVIPDSVTRFDDCAFIGCNRLTSITLPNGLMRIGNQMFESCSSLTEIHYKGTVEEWKGLEKGIGWKTDTGDFTVHCTNGDLDKNGNVIE